MGVRGANIVVLGVEKRAAAKLQDDRTVRKIISVDDHVAMAFAGLSADARVLVDKARVECQSHRLSVEDIVTVEYITRFLSSTKQVCQERLGLFFLCVCLSTTPNNIHLLVQRYTQSNGRRPFGVAALIVGFDPDGTARLFETDPAGNFSEWKVGVGEAGGAGLLAKRFSSDGGDCARHARPTP